MKRTLQENLFIKWISWYFWSGPKDLFQIWVDFLRFAAHFFSIFSLLRTLINPWKRISESYKGIANISENFQVLVLNTFSRVVGFFVRITIISIGIVVISLIFVFGIVAFTVWFLLPFLIILGLLLSFSILF